MVKIEDDSTTAHFLVTSLAGTAARTGAGITGGQRDVPEQRIPEQVLAPWQSSVDEQEPGPYVLLDSLIAHLGVTSFHLIGVSFLGGATASQLAVPSHLLHEQFLAPVQSESEEHLLLPHLMVSLTAHWEAEGGQPLAPSHLLLHEQVLAPVQSESEEHLLFPVQLTVSTTAHVEVASLCSCSTGPPQSYCICICCYCCIILKFILLIITFAFRSA